MTKAEEYGGLMPNKALHPTFMRSGVRCFLWLYAVSGRKMGSIFPQEHRVI